MFLAVAVLGGCNVVFPIERQQVATCTERARVATAPAGFSVERTDGAAADFATVHFVTGDGQGGVARKHATCMFRPGTTEVTASYIADD